MLGTAFSSLPCSWELDYETLQKSLTQLFPSTLSILGRSLSLLDTLSPPGPASQRDGGWWTAGGPGPLAPFPHAHL